MEGAEDGGTKIQENGVHKNCVSRKSARRKKPKATEDYCNIDDVVDSSVSEESEEESDAKAIAIFKKSNSSFFMVCDDLKANKSFLKTYGKCSPKANIVESFGLPDEPFHLSHKKKSLDYDECNLHDINLYDVKYLEAPWEVNYIEQVFFDCDEVRVKGEIENIPRKVRNLKHRGTPENKKDCSGAGGGKIFTSTPLVQVVVNNSSKSSSVESSKENFSKDFIKNLTFSSGNESTVTPENDVEENTVPIVEAESDKKKNGTLKSLEEPGNSLDNVTHTANITKILRPTNFNVSSEVLVKNESSEKKLNEVVNESNDVPVEKPPVPEKPANLFKTIKIDTEKLKRQLRATLAKNKEEIAVLELNVKSVNRSELGISKEVLLEATRRNETKEIVTPKRNLRSFLLPEDGNPVVANDETSIIDKKKTKNTPNKVLDNIEPMENDNKVSVAKNKKSEESPDKRKLRLNLFSPKSLKTNESASSDRSLSPLVSPRTKRIIKKVSTPQQKPKTVQAEYIEEITNIIQNDCEVNTSQANVFRVEEEDVVFKIDESRRSMYLSKSQESVKVAPDSAPAKIKRRSKSLLCEKTSDSDSDSSPRCRSKSFCKPDKVVKEKVAPTDALSNMLSKSHEEHLQLLEHIKQKGDSFFARENYTESSCVKDIDEDSKKIIKQILLNDIKLIEVPARRLRSANTSLEKIEDSRIKERRKSKVVTKIEELLNDKDAETGVENSLTKDTDETKKNQEVTVDFKPRSAKGRYIRRKFIHNVKTVKKISEMSLLERLAELKKAKVNQQEATSDMSRLRSDKANNLETKTTTNKEGETVKAKNTEKVEQTKRLRSANTSLERIESSQSKTKDGAEEKQLVVEGKRLRSLERTETSQKKKDAETRDDTETSKDEKRLRSSNMSLERIESSQSKTKDGAEEKQLVAEGKRLRSLGRTETNQKKKDKAVTRDDTETSKDEKRLISSNTSLEGIETSQGKTKDGVEEKQPVVEGKRLRSLERTETSQKKKDKAELIDDAEKSKDGKRLRSENTSLERIESSQNKTKDGAEEKQPVVEGKRLRSLERTETSQKKKDKAVTRDDTETSKDEKRLRSSNTSLEGIETGQDGVEEKQTVVEGKRLRSSERTETSQKKKDKAELIDDAEKSKDRKRLRSENTSLERIESSQNKTKDGAEEKQPVVEGKRLRSLERTETSQKKKDTAESTDDAETSKDGKRLRSANTPLERIETSQSKTRDGAEEKLPLVEGKRLRSLERTETNQRKKDKAETRDDTEESKDSKRLRSADTSLERFEGRQSKTKDGAEDKQSEVEGKRLRSLERVETNEKKKDKPEPTNAKRLRSANTSLERIETSQSKTKDGAEEKQPTVESKRLRSANTSVERISTSQKTKDNAEPTDDDTENSKDKKRLRSADASLERIDTESTDDGEDGELSRSSNDYYEFIEPFVGRKFDVMLPKIKINKGASKNSFRKAEHVANFAKILLNRRDAPKKIKHVVKIDSERPSNNFDDEDETIGDDCAQTLNEQIDKEDCRRLRSASTSLDSSKMNNLETKEGEKTQPNSVNEVVEVVPINEVIEEILPKQTRSESKKNKYVPNNAEENESRRLRSSSSENIGTHKDKTTETNREQQEIKPRGRKSDVKKAKAAENQIIDEQESKPNRRKSVTCDSDENKINESESTPKGRKSESETVRNDTETEPRDTPKIVKARGRPRKSESKKLIEKINEKSKEPEIVKTCNDKSQIDKSRSRSRGRKSESKSATDTVVVDEQLKEAETAKTETKNKIDKPRSISRGRKSESKNNKNAAEIEEENKEPKTAEIKDESESASKRRRDKEQNEDKIKTKTDAEIVFGDDNELEKPKNTLKRRKAKVVETPTKDKIDEQVIKLQESTTAEIEIKDKNEIAEPAITPKGRKSEARKANNAAEILIKDKEQNDKFEEKDKEAKTPKTGKKDAESKQEPESTPKGRRDKKLDDDKIYESKEIKKTKPAETEIEDENQIDEPKSITRARKSESKKIKIAETVTDEEDIKLKDPITDANTEVTTRGRIFESKTAAESAITDESNKYKDPETKDKTDTPDIKSKKPKTVPNDSESEISEPESRPKSRRSESTNIKIDEPRSSESKKNKNATEIAAKGKKDTQIAETNEQERKSESTKTKTAKEDAEIEDKKTEETDLNATDESTTSEDDITVIDKNILNLNQISSNLRIIISPIEKHFVEIPDTSFDVPTEPVEDKDDPLFIGSDTETVPLRRSDRIFDIKSVEEPKEDFRRRSSRLQKNETILIGDTDNESENSDEPLSSYIRKLKNDASFDDNKEAEIIDEENLEAINKIENKLDETNEILITIMNNKADSLEKIDKALLEETKVEEAPEAADTVQDNASQKSTKRLHIIEILDDDVELGLDSLNNKQIKIEFAKPQDLEQQPAQDKNVMKRRLSNASIATMDSLQNDMESIDWNFVKEETLTFDVGNIVWAKIGAYPFWPSLVTRDPENNSFVRTYGPKRKLVYHVRFFADKGRRAWVKLSDLLMYQGRTDLEALTKRVKAGEKMTYNLDAFVVRPTHRDKWSAAVEEADSVKDKTVDEKLDFFFNLFASKREKKQRELEKMMDDACSVTSESSFKSKKRKAASKDDIEMVIKKRKMSSPKKKFKEEESESTVGEEEIFLPRLRRRNYNEDPFDTESKLSENSVNSSALAAQTALYQRNKLFKGIPKEKVCQQCHRPGEIFKCKGCSGIFHFDCSKKEKEEITLFDTSDEREESTIIEINDEAPPEILRNNQVEIVTVQSSKNCTPPKKTFPAMFKDMSLCEQLDYKLKEYMMKFNNVTIYPESSDSSGDDFPTKPALTAGNGTTTPLNEEELILKIKEELEKDENGPHVTADCENVEPKKESEQKVDIKNFKCYFCSENDVPSCSICLKADSPNGSYLRQKCSLSYCGKYFHQDCLKLWPQTQWQLTQTKLKDSDEIVDTFVCPIHSCHTCCSDDPRNSHMYRTSADKLVKCLCCPATYHCKNFCIPAGTEIVTTSQIICPRHPRFSKKHHRTLNTTWCFVCSKGGDLVCCESCPTSIHPECVEGKIRIEDKFICEDCQSGRFPLYDEIVWCKLGNYRWWPGVILFPSDIPDNVRKLKHDRGDFVVKFYGTYDHYWLSRGRTFIYQEGDKGTPCSHRNRINHSFSIAVNEAVAAHRVKREFRRNMEAKKNNEMKPPPYIKIKVNKAVGSVRQFDSNLSNATACECDPNSSHPCGPDSDCINRLLLTECNPAVCPAGERCNNQCFEKREYPPLMPYRTADRGWGLKTLAPIKKGQFVIEYVGELIDETEYQRRIAKMHECMDENYYFLTIDKDRMLDAGPKGNVARFMNHSCQPNCETQKWTVDGDTRVGLFAMGEIPADMELTFNYNLECVGKEKKVCMCGAPNCSGFIGVKAKQEDHKKKSKKLLAGAKKKRTLPLRGNMKKSLCFVCGRKSYNVKSCNNKICNKSYHLRCLKLTSWPEGNKFVCPWHNCKICTKRTIRCCVKCLNSYCPHHSEGNIRHDKLLGYICSEHDPRKETSELEVSKITKKKSSNTITEETAVTSTTSSDEEFAPVERNKKLKKRKTKDQLDEVCFDVKEAVTSSPTKTPKENESQDENLVTSASTNDTKKRKRSSADEPVKKRARDSVRLSQTNTANDSGSNST